MDIMQSSERQKHSTQKQLKESIGMNAEETYLYCGRKNSGSLRDSGNRLFYLRNKRKLETDTSCFRISRELKTK